MHPILFHTNYLGFGRRTSDVAHSTPVEKHSLLLRWARGVMRRWQRRKLIAALEAMDDRLLRDIGIYRGDIANVVDGFTDRELRMRPLAPSVVQDTQQKYRKSA